ncbi:hypothetical protein [Paracidovorax wautersii]|nr:hypothetical protein [Paracidovorax wautersii]
MAPEMLDAVTLALRRKPEAGEVVGPLVGVGATLGREQVAAIGLAFLELCNRMTASSMYTRSQALQAAGQQVGVEPLTEGVRAILAGMQRDTSLARNIMVSSAEGLQNLHSRAHILHRAQSFLELASSDMARQLELLLIAMELGIMPVRIDIVSKSDAAIGPSVH